MGPQPTTSATINCIERKSTLVQDSDHWSRKVCYLSFLSTTRVPHTHTHTHTHTTHRPFPDNLIKVVCTSTEVTAAPTEQSDWKWCAKKQETGKGQFEDFSPPLSHRLSLFFVHSLLWRCSGRKALPKAQEEGKWGNQGSSWHQVGPRTCWISTIQQQDNACPWPRWTTSLIHKVGVGRGQGTRENNGSKGTAATPWLGKCPRCPSRGGRGKRLTRPHRPGLEA